MRRNSFDRLDIAEVLIGTGLVGAAALLGTYAAHESLDLTAQNVNACVEALADSEQGVLDIPEACDRYRQTFDSSLAAVDGEVERVYTLPIAADFRRVHTPNEAIIYISFIAGAELALYMGYILLEMRD